MHMSDALVSTPVALTAGAVATALIITAGVKLRNPSKENILPLMGVLGAFIFAAQMVNFAIPGTGSSGHIVGGILLAAFVGPWAGFLTLCSVIIIQCLVFADGGLLALGCNIINMAVMSTLVAYPLIFRPIAGQATSGWRLILASLASCVVALELGAFLAVNETVLSGVTALPYGKFLGVMTAIHFLIGIGEGLATAAILTFVAARRPGLLYVSQRPAPKRVVRRAALIFAAAAVAVGGGLAFLASSHPDGLEWSILKVAGVQEACSHDHHHSGIAHLMEHVQQHTAVMPEYENPLSGVIGSLMVLLVVWAISVAVTAQIRKRRPKNEEL